MSDLEDAELFLEHRYDLGDDAAVILAEQFQQVRDKAIEECKAEAVAWTIQNPATHDGIIQNQVASKIAKHIGALKDN